MVPAILAPIRERKVLEQLGSGAASGLASSVLLQHLDLLKTRIQQDGDSSRSVKLPIHDLLNEFSPGAGCDSNDIVERAR